MRETKQLFLKGISQYDSILICSSTLLFQMEEFVFLYPVPKKSPAGTHTVWKPSKVILRTDDLKACSVSKAESFRVILLTAEFLKLIFTLKESFTEIDSVELKVLMLSDGILVLADLSVSFVLLIS